MSWQVGLYLTAVALPLIAFVVEIAAGRRLKHRTASLATAAIAGSFLLSLVGSVHYFATARGVFDQERAGQHEPLAWRQDFAFVDLGSSLPPTQSQPAGEPLAIRLGIAVDNLTVLMFLMITFVATVVHFFAIDYMRDDPRFARFFAYLSLFCGSMLALVASSNLFFIFVFWELVGFCSYLLIGFWHQERANVEAANKAFLMNRIGDVGLIIGLALLWTNLGTLDIREINQRIRDNHGSLNVRTMSGISSVELVDPVNKVAFVDPSTGFPRRISYALLVVAGLGIFAGCVGKSAQFPLNVWLPDAMAGPTPVSALIHAATMVAAGVYLVGRVFPIFTPEVLLTIAYTGGITLFIAGTIATVQTDYKKVLAYSTVSQLGFMMLALGVGGRSAGLFHLLTHACFKALLFLGAGSVYHSVHTYEMTALGGLQKRLKITSLCMLVATLAIAGVPFFSGFASKDAILTSSLHFVLSQPEHLLLFLLPATGAALTAFYMVRFWFLIFAGEPRGPAARKAHEGGRLLIWPLIALAIPTISIGWPLPFLGFKPVLEQMLEYGEPLESIDPGGAGWWALGASILLLAIGMGVGALAYGPWERWRRLSPRKTAERFSPIHGFLVQKWYLDQLYSTIFVGPTLALSRAVGWFDRRLVDSVVDRSAWSVRRLSRLEGVFDRVAVDGLVKLVVRVISITGDHSRRLQTGSLRTYLLVLAAGVVGIFAAMYAWVLA